MSISPDISVIVSTYQRPEHLRRSLLSLALQRGVDRRFEIVVADDGSADHTSEVVDRFARTVSFPVRFVTHEHCGFHAARCRNNGVHASTASYLIFFDGDCVFPSDHLLQHLRARRPGMARTGDSYRLNEESVRHIDDAAIASDTFVQCVPKDERRRLFWRWIREECYSAARHPYKPKVMAGNLAVWRSDFERINGFDEQFIGWGCEDDDLGQRLRRSGVRVAPIFGYTQAYHLWHPPHPTVPARWRDGRNVEYFLKSDKPVRCEIGLASHASQAGSIPEDFSHDGDSSCRRAWVA